MVRSKLNLKKGRIGLSLIEIVVVILILGIITSIAVPNYLNHARRTKDRSQQIKLLMLRDAIERYIIEHDRQLPDASTQDVFKSAVLNYLPADFPALELQHSTLPDNFDPAGVALVDSDVLMAGESNPAQAWKYNSDTGEIIINLDWQTFLDPAVHYDQW